MHSLPTPEKQPQMEDQEKQYHYCGAVLAMEGMLQLLREQHNLSRVDALALSSLLVDLRVTQVVNRVKGVHAVLGHGVMESMGRGT